MKNISVRWGPFSSGEQFFSEPLETTVRKGIRAQLDRYDLDRDKKAAEEGIYQMFAGLDSAIASLLSKVANQKSLDARRRPQPVWLLQLMAQVVEQLQKDHPGRHIGRDWIIDAAKSHIESEKMPQWEERSKKITRHQVERWISENTPALQ